MKILQLFIAALILSYAAQSQTYSTVATPIKWTKGGFDSLFLPQSDTLTPKDKTRSWITIKDSVLYVWNVAKWKPVTGAPNNIYTTNGTLTSDRTVTANQKKFYVTGAKQIYLKANDTGQVVQSILSISKDEGITMALTNFPKEAGFMLPQEGGYAQTFAGNNTLEVNEDSVIVNGKNIARSVNGNLANPAGDISLDKYTDSLISLRNPLPYGFKNQIIKALSDNTNQYTTQDPVNISRRYVLSDAQLTSAKTTATSFKTIFDTWNRFSVYDATPNPYDAEKNSWRYNDTTQTILTTSNSSSYIGFYSPKAYKNYTVSGTMSASNEDILHDNDIITFVIGVVTGADSKLHTISLVRMRNTQPEFKINGQFIRYSIVYDLAVGSNKVLANGDSLAWNTTNAWDAHEMDFKVVRAGDSISVFISNFDDAPGGKGSLRFPLTINLADYEETQQFRNGAAYGFGAVSQANATFKNVVTNVSEDAIYDLRKPFNVWLPSSAGSYAIDTSAHFEHTRQWFHNPIYNFWSYVDGNDSLRVITTSTGSTGNADSLNHQPASYYVNADATNATAITTEQTARIVLDAAALHKTGDETKTGKLGVTDSLYSTNSVSLKRSGYSLDYTTPNVSSGVGETQGIAYDSVGNAYVIGTTVLRKYDSSHTTILANNTSPFTGLTYTYIHFNDGDVYKSKLAIPTYAVSPTYKKALLIYNLDLSFFKELRIPDVVGGISAGSIQKDTLYMASYEDPAPYKIWKYLVPDYGSSVDSVTLIDSLVFAPQGDIWRVQGIKVVNDTIFTHTDQGEIYRCSLDGSNFRLVSKLDKPDYFINAEGIDWVNGQLRVQYDSTGAGISTHIAYLNPIANTPIITASRNARLKVNGLTDFNGNVSVNGNVAIQSKSFLDFVLNRKNKPDFRIGQPDRLGIFAVYDSTLIPMFTVAQGGNVGIGLGYSKAASKLQVAGTFSASGNSTVGGTLGVTGATTLSSASLSGALTSTSTATFNTTTAGQYTPLALSQSATSGSSTNSVVLTLKAYDGTAVNSVGEIRQNAAGWSYGTGTALQLNITAIKNGIGLRSASSKPIQIYLGSNTDPYLNPEVWRFSTGGLSNTGADANANSVLDLASTTKGVLLPRMSRTQFAAITATQGNFAYGTLLDKFIYSNGTTVKTIDDSATIVAKYRQISDTAASGTSTATINQLQKRIDSLSATLIKTGVAFFSGDGSTTTFDIPLSVTPSWAMAESSSTAAAGITYRTFITNGIRIFYTVAPPSGTNNISITYSYK